MPRRASPADHQPANGRSITNRPAAIATVASTMRGSTRFSRASRPRRPRVFRPQASRPTLIQAVMPVAAAMPTTPRWRISTNDRAKTVFSATVIRLNFSGVLVSSRA